MTGIETYSKLKALLNILETQLDKVDREALTPFQLKELSEQTNEAFKMKDAPRD